MGQSAKPIRENRRAARKATLEDTLGWEHGHRTPVTLHTYCPLSSTGLTSGVTALLGRHVGAVQRTGSGWRGVWYDVIRPLGMPR